MHALKLPLPADDIDRPWPSRTKEDGKTDARVRTRTRCSAPREVDEHFSHGKERTIGEARERTTHCWRHARPRLLRVTRRENGDPYLHSTSSISRAIQRSRAACADRCAGRCGGPHLRATARCKSVVPCARAALCVPQWRVELTSAWQRADSGFPSAPIDGVDWYWRPMRVSCVMYPKIQCVAGTLRPVVRDALASKLLWGWVTVLKPHACAQRKLAITQCRALARPRDWLG